jgi:predicted DNA-binding antitoxin AbrB/MazE fold protein
MLHSIRAIYAKGQLRLLESVNLAEGQEIEVMILSEKEKVRLALGDLLVEVAEPIDAEFDEAKLMREIETDFHSQTSLSDTIINERHEGP